MSIRVCRCTSHPAGSSGRSRSSLSIRVCCWTSHPAGSSSSGGSSSNSACRCAVAAAAVAREGSMGEGGGGGISRVVRTLDPGPRHRLHRVTEHPGPNAKGDAIILVLAQPELDSMPAWHRKHLHGPCCMVGTWAPAAWCTCMTPAAWWAPARPLACCMVHLHGPCCMVGTWAPADHPPGQGAHLHPLCLLQLEGSNCRNQSGWRCTPVRPRALIEPQA